MRPQAEPNPFHPEGGNTAVLLIQGFTGSPAEMRPIGESLHAKAWETVADLTLQFIQAETEKEPRAWTRS